MTVQKFTAIESDTKKVIVFLIRSLGLGGAERQLLLAASGLAKLGHSVTIITFYQGVELEYSKELLQADTLSIISLGKRGRWYMFVFVSNYLRHIKAIKPDIVYSFMNTASLLALSSHWFDRKIKLVWGVRSSNMMLSDYDWTAKVLRRIESYFSKRADCIISNSYAGMRQAIEDGFSGRNLCVVPNGIDTTQFKRDPKVRRLLRERYSLADDDLLIGVVARHDPMKGLDTIITAFAGLLDKGQNYKLMIVGSGSESYTRKLHDLAVQYAVNDNILWVSKTTDVADYYSMFDIYTSGSRYGEGFSNTIAEAMASELVCIVTSVGDAKEIVGCEGIIIPADSQGALIEAWLTVGGQSSSTRQDMGKEARARVLSLYTVEAMISRTAGLLALLDKSKN